MADVRLKTGKAVKGLVHGPRGCAGSRLPGDRRALLTETFQTLPANVAGLGTRQPAEDPHVPLKLGVCNDLFALTRRCEPEGDNERDHSAGQSSLVFVVPPIRRHD